MLKTPIVFIIFNRPETTRRVFETIRAQRPERLLVTADGPRRDREGEAALCSEARAIVDEVDWPCEVQRNYSETNLGCREGVSSGITWAFEQVSEAIILEDDVVPHPSFFSYCAELLERYRHQPRVMGISGGNFRKRPGPWQGDGSYHFAKQCHVWGWATWRRAWRHYDVTMSDWPKFRNSRAFRKITRTPEARRHWTRVFDSCHSGELSTWDPQWNFTLMRQNGLGIVPNVNLVSNIGFGPEATHTRQSDHERSNMEVHDIMPLRHPSKMVVCDEAKRSHDVQRRKSPRLSRLWRSLLVKK